MVDHTDLAHDAFELSGLLPTPPYRTVDDALRYVTILLGIIPASEHLGYVKAPAGGSNVAVTPDGLNLVRAGRVMSPDGQIYKVMSDVPNGGPQWVAEDSQPALYVPYVSTPLPGPVPNDSELERRVVALEALFKAVHSQLGTLNEQAAKLDGRIAALEARPMPAPTPAPTKPSWWPF